MSYPFVTFSVEFHFVQLKLETERSIIRYTCFRFPRYRIFPQHYKRLQNLIENADKAYSETAYKFVPKTELQTLTKTFHLQHI